MADAAKEIASKVRPAKKPDVDAIETSAVADFMAAVEEGDVEMAKSALKDFVVACMKRQDKGGY